MSSDEATKPAIIEQDGEEGEKKFRWPPLESNPEVFTNYLQSVRYAFQNTATDIFELLHHFLTLYSTSHYQIGLPPTFSIGEVFGFDEELLAFIPQPVLGK